MIDIETHEHGLVEVVINRPEAKNALTLKMYEVMTQALREADAQEETRVVMIRGEGAGFTAGNDLRDFMESPPTDEDSPVYQFLSELVQFSKPLVCAVDGWAVGIGTTMLLHCDLVYASERSTFQMPFVHLALVPEAGASLILPRMMGHQKAAELLFFSEKFDADKAHALGLVNAVLPADEVVEHARERATRLTELAPTSLKLTKQLLKSSQHRGLDEVMSREGELFMERLQSAEVAEAITAFFEKRKPNF